MYLHMVWFGHIMRRSSENIEPLMERGEVEGKRLRKRSPIRWTDQVSEQPDIPISKALHQATNRVQRRKDGKGKS